MKKIRVAFSLISAVVLTLSLSSCLVTDKIPSLVEEALVAYTNSIPETTPSASTNEAPTNTVAPEVSQAPVGSAPGTVARGPFVRPAIAVNNAGKLFVAAEGSSMGSMFLYYQDGSAWKGGLIVKSVKGGEADAGRVYVPDIEAIDETAWVSMRLGNKEWGKMRGPAIYILQPNRTGVFKFLPSLTEGAARLSQQDGKVFLMSKNGRWGQLNSKADIVSSGSFNAGNTGEKFDFCISSGKWATVMNGYSEMDGALAYGVPPKGTRLSVSDYKTYIIQGDDLCYPSTAAIGSKVYFASVYSGRLYANICDNGKLLRPSTNLYNLAEATKEQRCPPRLVNTPKGMYVLFRRGKDLMKGNVDKMIAGVPAVKFAQGEFPAGVWNPISKKLIVVYVGDDALRVLSVDP